ncbi:acyl-CoA dehydrogenase [Paracoccus sp. YIM 132242]|uniref:Acyl-CoA dehydrogenase n=1 Tax=Paracoccus lichenicola TaxID=2665644 RepID=A0A6L6HQ82_9RHOB|nr:acyl-CoA dehydrogenase family protein [Paracoccus lichenicola]MTE00579.1 acyl-CoA dehydrogenase [Paracoccus lichenicola]
MTGILPPDLAGWLAAQAKGIDAGDVPAALILPRLADAGLARVGVPGALGGQGGTAMDAVGAIAAVARESLAAAFMLWGHRCFVEFMVRTPNHALRDRLLPDLLAGRLAGASGLSNVMKFLAGLEPLEVTARPEGDALVIDGILPWVTNLREQGFVVATAADPADGGPALILALAHDDPGVSRGADLALMAMRSSDTAALRIEGARVPRDRIIAADAPGWLPGVRPAFLAMQCGLPLGLARRSLDEAAGETGAGRGVLAAPIAALRARLDQVAAALEAGLASGGFVTRPAALFELRIALSDIAFEAVSLELQAGGGRCYLQGPGGGFARRWREAAFVPVITPSTVQLRTALAALGRAA